MTTNYVASGYKVDKVHLGFYIEEDDLIRFFKRVREKVADTDPDFVSLRMVKSDS